MHDDRLLVEGRLERALAQFVRPAQYSARLPMTAHAWHVRGEPVPVAEALRASYEPIRPGTAWGTPWSTSWFRFEAEVPKEWAGRRVEAVLDPGFTGEHPGFQAEGLVYDDHGVPIKGVHPRNRHVPVASPAEGGEPVRLLLEAAANPTVLRDFRPTRLGDVLTAGDEPLYRFGSADLAVLDEDVWQLTLDIDVLSELMHQLDPKRTLVIVVSKTFTTQETLLNGGVMRDWISRAYGGDKAAVSRHFLAVSANVPEAEKWGVPAAQVYPMWDFVGGRFSVWSAVGLSLALSIGSYNFHQFLKGAALVDDLSGVLDDATFATNEGCLSMPDVRGDLERFENVGVRYLDRDGEAHEVTRRGLTAGTFQHEVDHLDGILFVDRMADMSSLSTWEEFERHGKADFVARIEALVERVGS